MSNKCLVCGKSITYTFAICSDCEKIYGNRSSEWEPWLRFLWQDTQRQRRRDKNIIAFEVELDGTTAPDDYDYISYRKGLHNGKVRRKKASE